MHAAASRPRKHTYRRGAAAMLAATIALCGAGAGAVTVSEFALPSDQAMPTSITGAADGNLWFTEFSSRKIGRITPQGQITEFPIANPVGASNPLAIARAADGNVWFLAAGLIGRITTAGVVSQYTLPFGDDSNAQGLAAGPDGNMWFTQSRCAYCDPNAPGQKPNEGATIGKITPQGTITEYTLPDYHAGPRDITAGPDGKMWFTEYVGNKIGRIATNGTVTEFALPVANSFPMGITTGSDGNLWFVENRCNLDCGMGNFSGVEVIGRITPAGAISEFPTSSGIGGGNGVGSIAIVEAADHNLWFAEPASNKIGRITHAGAITEFDIHSAPPPGFPANVPFTTAPLGVANGPDGNVWFVEAQLGFGGKVGKVQLDAAVAIGAGFTGNWFNPTQSGHGFSIEVLPDNKMLAQWYVFAPNGGQSWIVATGDITGNSAQLQGFQPIGSGGQFPPNFNPAQLTNTPWGTLTFSFSDCNHGQASWQPTAAGYASGSMPITRLTMPAGLSCP